MKNYIILLSILSLSACKKALDLSPESSISDANYWKTADQFDAFVTGVHTQFRSDNVYFLFLGELRSDIFGTDPGSSTAFTGEATQGLENAWNQTLTLDNPVVSNFGGFYYNINQINLLINKIYSTTVLTSADKNYYLGIAYGLRAFYYFQMVRSWGDVVIQTDPVTNIDVSSLAKAASPASDVMLLIKEDIDSSETNFGTDYSFMNTKSFWSKPATLMLKAEVYLWTAHRDGGTADAAIAENALTDIQANVSALSLLSDYEDIFSTTNRGNDEVIFASRYLLNEATQSFISTYFVPQTGLIANYYDSVENRQFNTSTDNWGGLLRAPVLISTFRKFDDADTRKWVSIQAAYTLSGTEYTIAGCFAGKYSGEQSSSVRYYTNDFIIYRYADLLLLLAEAKVMLGESPATEINQVRARAFGSAYDASVNGYPNQAIDSDPYEAILQERLYEFILEGKRWYDLRRMGDDYVFEHTSVLSSESYKLLWPIDRSSLTNNSALVQTTGYASF
ncbi:SusD family outer membrane lipoprotein NanU [Parafilimonas sp.]|uniref:SusD family outer membrane lipoprotein NanU n=1 Tax=Parafilimonas sp. TaxID=1969739 RepID=UPI0039E5A5BA